MGFWKFDIEMKEPEVKGKNIIWLPIQPQDVFRDIIAHSMTLNSKPAARVALVYMTVNAQKTEQNPQKAGWRGQVSNFLARDLFKINYFLTAIT